MKIVNKEIVGDQKAKSPLRKSVEQRARCDEVHVFIYY